MQATGDKGDYDAASMLKEELKTQLGLSNTSQDYKKQLQYDGPVFDDTIARTGQTQAPFDGVSNYDNTPRCW